MLNERYHGSGLHPLNIDLSLTRKLITIFIHDELGQVGFNKAIVGISGGIDSALVAYLAVEALGKENVLGLRLPYKASSDDSLHHAMLVIEDLGIPHDTIEITSMVEPLFERFPEMSRMRRGNVMSRQRMIVLYDQSEAFNGLVVGTSNKTEALLGYATIFGDSSAAIQPIGDLYKYQVRQLAREMGVPDVIVNKPPSADLWPGQTDETELGYTYDQADEVLYMLVDQRYTIDDCDQAGIDRAFAEKVWRTVQRSQYKRRLPIVPKLSGRTIGPDFRYLRDWGASDIPTRPK